MRFLSLVLALAVLASPVGAQADQTSPELDGLFERLKTTFDVAETAAVEAAIWTIWLHQGTAEIDRDMALGIAAMLSPQEMLLAGSALASLSIWWAIGLAVRFGEKLTDRREDRDAR